jgi:uncharacterized Zn-binding protein involved in type VI secretion
MSAIESAQRAARLTDPIGHGLGFLGMIGGMLLGAVIGGLLLGAAIATGGALLIAVAAFAAIGCVAGGGLSGGQLVNGLQTAMALPDPQTGVLGPVASPNVRIGMHFAARATDPAVSCNGLMSLIHFPTPLVKIAEGAASIYINNLPAARVTSKLVCGAEIKDGEAPVVLGGPTVRVLAVHDPEEELQGILSKMLVVSLIGVAVLQPETIPAILGFMGLSTAAGDLADAIWGPNSGARNIVQGLLGLAALGLVARDPGDLGGVDEAPARLSPEELQAAADKILNALPDDIAKTNRTVTVTEGVDENGNVVYTVTSSNGSLTAAQKAAAQEALGPDVNFPPSDVSGKQPNNENHAEQRGIRATAGQTDLSQASSSGAKHGGAACPQCWDAQQGAGVNNVTGAQPPNGTGRVDRPN